MSNHIAYVATPIFKAAQKYIENFEDRIEFYKIVIAAFEDADCSTLYECTEGDDSPDPDLVKLLMEEWE